jgi:hypothetical protein
LIESEKLKIYLKKRGYSYRVIRRAFVEVVKRDREDIRKPKGKDKNQRMSFPLTYNPAFKNIGSSFHNNFRTMLERSERQQKSHVNGSPFLAFRRVKNLGNLLVRADKEKTEIKDSGEFIPCHMNQTRQCQMCAKHQVGIKKKISINGTEKKINGELSCGSRNIVYLMECKEHPEESYIGETKQKAKERFTNHRSCAKRCERETGGIAKHFRDVAHEHGKESLIMTPFQKMTKNDDVYRKFKEEELIMELSPTLNRAEDNISLDMGY